MLDLRFVRENLETVEKAIARRNGGFSLQELVDTDGEYRQILAEWENLNRRKNEISEAFKTGSAKPEEKEALKEESKNLKQRHEEISKRRQELEEKLNELSLGIPNMPDPSVPDGADENENVVVSTWGAIPVIENPRHHFEIGTDLGIFDFERGVKVAESRFTVLMNYGARMERALMNFMLDSHGANGYVEVFPPILINRDCMVGTGQLPKF
ncbi:MAG: serine--tRNA ligase, partial [Cyanobacteria bacterium HKST-UBA02]|nr:serine--tRNA ligase [Cyanobacteria bacterium HKST-UBA02]